MLPKKIRKGLLESYFVKYMREKGPKWLQDPEWVAFLSQSDVDTGT
jgi:hypothetical protein